MTIEINEEIARHIHHLEGLLMHLTVYLSICDCSDKKTSMLIVDYTNFFQGEGPGRGGEIDHIFFSCEFGNHETIKSAF